MTSPMTVKSTLRLDLATSGDAWEQVLADLRAQERQVQSLRMSDALATIEGMWVAESGCAWLEAPTLKVDQQVLLGA
jgi:hypothetical protein